MSWRALLPQAELPEGARRVVEVEAQSILLLQHQGRIHAVAARCPHLGGRLDKGALTDDGGIVCPRHHSAFDLATGDVKAWSPWPPGVGAVLGAFRREHALPVYPVRVQDGAIWVEL